MAATFIWKPATVSGHKGGPVFLAPSESSGTPVITGPDGTKYTGKYYNDNEGRKQWIFPPEVIKLKGLKVEYGGQTTTIEDGSAGYEGNDLNSFKPRAGGKGSVGDASGSDSGGNVPTGLQPFQRGDGSSPPYLGNQYPIYNPVNFKPVQYTNIKPADYKLTDPAAFAKNYGDFNRNEVRKNFNQAGDFALSQLGTELQGLQGFAPAAAALKRRETAADNVTNQAARTSQVQSVLPDVQAGLQKQTGDAATYASGRLLSNADDRALELGTRSNAADTARTRGFGDNSTAAANASDRMSAEERFKISQYGNQLKTQNSQDRQQLELAPTEYSNAGNQISVMPTVSTSQAQSQYTQEQNRYSTIDAGTALATTVDQQKFKTNLSQETTKFNAQNNLQNDQFNTSKKVEVDTSNSEAKFTRDLGKFNYDQGFASNLAGLDTATASNAKADKIRGELLDAFKKSAKDSRNSSTASSILSALGLAPKIIKGVTDLIKGNATDVTTSTSYDPTTIDPSNSLPSQNTADSGYSQNADPYANNETTTTYNYLGFNPSDVQNSLSNSSSSSPNTDSVLSIPASTPSSSNISTPDEITLT